MDGHQISNEELLDLMISHRISIAWSAANLKVNGMLFNYHTMRRHYGEDPKDWVRAAVAFAVRDGKTASA